MYARSTCPDATQHIYKCQRFDQFFFFYLRTSVKEKANYDIKKATPATTTASITITIKEIINDGKYSNNDVYIDYGDDSDIYRNKTY